MPKLSRSASPALPSASTVTIAECNSGDSRDHNAGFAIVAVASKFLTPPPAMVCDAASAVATTLPAPSRICQRTRQVSACMPSFCTIVPRLRVAELPFSVVVNDLCTNVALPLAQVQRVALGQPYMPVDARALVEPTVAKARFHANNQIVLAAVVDEVGQIEAERSIPVVVSANELSVEKDQRIAEPTVELNRHSTPAIAIRNLNRTAIPTHAGLRIAAAEWLVAVPLQRLVMHERQFHRPVMRKIQRAPLRVVELLRSEIKAARLGEVSLTGAKAEIAIRIAPMALKELPAEIEQQPLARSNGRCTGARIGQRRGARNCAARKKGGRDSRGSGTKQSTASQ